MTAPRWLDMHAAAAYISERVDYLPALVKRGLLPPPSFHLGPRKPRYDRLLIDAMFSSATPSTTDTAKEEARARLRDRLKGRAAQAGRRHDQGIPLRPQSPAAHGAGP